MGNILWGVIIGYPNINMEQLETTYFIQYNPNTQPQITYPHHQTPSSIYFCKIAQAYPSISQPILLLLMYWFLLAVLLAMSQSATIVQGFYWQQQLQYAHDQRRALLELLPPGSIYIYMPQIVDTLEPWTPQDLAEWRSTASYCKQQNIELIIGLRTLFIDNFEVTLSRVQAKIKQLDVPFILGWDDCQGGLNDAQKKLQLQIVQRVSRKPWAIIPAAYYSEKGSISKWVLGLTIINDADPSIPFILCSKSGINPSTMDPDTDFPPLKRKMIFWDNWMAVDSLDHFPRNLPRSRSLKLFDDSQPFGYMLNLCFPPERIVHGIASIQYQQQGLEYNYTQIAGLWTKYLLKHGFISQADTVQMQKALWQLIYYSDGTMVVSELVKQYPILSAFLYD